MRAAVEQLQQECSEWLIIIIITTTLNCDKILNLVLSSEPTSIAQIEALCPFCSSNHCQVNLDIFVDNTQAHNLLMYKNSTGNYDGMSDLLLNTDWPRILSENPTV